MMSLDVSMMKANFAKQLRGGTSDRRAPALPRAGLRAAVWRVRAARYRAPVRATFGGVPFAGPERGLEALGAGRVRGWYQRSATGACRGWQRAGQQATSGPGAAGICLSFACHACCLPAMARLGLDSSLSAVLGRRAC
jgi:hypothetical protein